MKRAKGLQTSTDNAKRLSLLLLATTAFACTCLAQNNSEDKEVQWQLNNERYALMDREKTLKKLVDDLSLVVFETKRQINQMHKQLNASESNLEDARHDLITVQMKLIR